MHFLDNLCYNTTCKKFYGWWLQSERTGAYDLRELGKEHYILSVFQAISLMIAFATLMVLVDRNNNDRK